MRREIFSSTQTNGSIAVPNRYPVLGLLIVALAAVPLCAADQRPSGAPDEGVSAQAIELAREGLRHGMAGDLDARAKALARALELDANCPLAHWHQGEMEFDGRWFPADEAARRIARDLDFEDYARLRDQVSAKPDGDLVLANWCREHGLPAPERLHLYRVLEASTDLPARNQAMRRLGLREYNGTLLPQEMIDGLQREAAVRQQQLAKWIDQVQEWAEVLTNGRARQRNYIREQMKEKIDVTAVPALEQVLGVHSDELAMELVALLARIDEHPATEALVRQSLFSMWPSVRNAAAGKLKERPLHDFVPLLLQALTAPIQTRFAVAVGPDGLVRHRHQLYREGPDINHLLDATYVGGPVLVPFQVRSRPRETANNPEQLASIRRNRRERLRQADMVGEMLAAQRAVESVRLEREVAVRNHQIATANQVVFAALQESTGQVGLPESPDAWWSWWQEYNETYQGERPTITRTVTVNQPYLTWVPFYRVTSSCCLPAGTKIRTLTGQQNIEQVRIGDRILSQDVETGELAYKLVLQTTDRPPSDLLEVRLGDTTVSTTKGHPFWVNGVGWRMAKQLQVGDQIHSLTGPLTVSAVEPLKPAVAYNVVVADYNNYFVGSAQVLAHDNTYRKPTRAVTPGLTAAASRVATKR